MFPCHYPHFPGKGLETRYGIRIPVECQPCSFAITGSGGERGRRFLWQLPRPKSKIVRRHINSHREQNEGCGDPKERAVVHLLPVEAMREVWSAMLLKLGIIHRAGHLCDK